MFVPKLAKNGFYSSFWGLGTLLNLAQVHLFSIATSLSGIQETELKPFLTIFGTGMRAKLLHPSIRGNYSMMLSMCCSGTTLHTFTTTLEDCILSIVSLYKR